MKNFTFYNPTRIHFGKGQVAKIKKEIPANAKVLFVSGGGSIKGNGIYQQVCDALTNYSVTEFSGITANPKYDVVEQAVTLVKEQQLDYVLAVGGGSVIDACKYIAAAALYQGDGWDFFTGKAKVERALPLGCILTLPATGSESNAGTVITRDKDKLGCLSDHFRPQFSILDPSFSSSLSERQVANGVVDAFVHVCEQYITQPIHSEELLETKIQDRYSEAILTTLIEEGLKAKNDPNDESVRANIMWAANQALNGLIGAGANQDWATHMIGHELTALYNIDHARTLSIILPALWKVRRAEKSLKLLQYAERVWAIETDDVDQAVDTAIRKTEEFFVAMNMPIRLSDVGVGEIAVEQVIQALANHGMDALGEDKNITLATSKEILKLALN